MKYSLILRQLLILFILLLFASCKEHPHLYNGYLDADLTYLSSDFSGRLTHLSIQRGDRVKQGQLLFKLEQTNEHFNVLTSQLKKKSLFAQKNAIIDEIKYDQINYHRTLRIRKQDAASQNDLDVAKKDLDILRNQLVAINLQIKSSQVEIANKRWRAQQKERYAPETGIIFDTYFTPGEYVQSGQPVLSLITKKSIKVLFFVPEKQLSQITLNQKVKISTDGSPFLATGRISYIANIAQYTPPMIYSRENREQLIFRLEARIDTPNLKKIHLGQPVSLEIIP